MLPLFHRSRAWDLLWVEEIANELKRQIQPATTQVVKTETVVKEVVKEPKYEQYIINTDMTINGVEHFKIEGEGEVREITLVAEGDFFIRFKIDGREILKGYISELTGLSKYADSFDAFIDAGTYIFHYPKFTFLKKVELVVKADNVYFKNIFIPYRLKIQYGDTA